MFVFVLDVVVAAKLTPVFRFTPNSPFLPSPSRPALNPATPLRGVSIHPLRRCMCPPSASLEAPGDASLSSNPLRVLASRRGARIGCCSLLFA